MAITRQLSNGQMMTDWTEEVNDIANQYGMLNGSGLFSGRGTSQTSILFDKTENQIKMIPQTNRRGGPASKGDDRKNSTFSIALPYFLHQDYLTPTDIQGYREEGTPDSEKSVASARADKLEDMRAAADQTREFMKCQALKGQTTDGEGNSIADMFSILDLSAANYEVDFQLGTATTNVDNKIAELKRNLTKGAKAGGRIGSIEVMCTPEFFDALVSHPNIREAYLHYQVQNPMSDVVRADLSTLMTWGVVDTFYHKGVLFYTYDAEFNSDDGDGTITVKRAIGENSGGRDTGTKEGFTVVRGMRNLYKGVFGPQNTLEGANRVGSEISVSEYRDPKDKCIDFELEMANLYYMTRPNLSYRVFSSN